MAELPVDDDGRPDGEADAVLRLDCSFSPMPNDGYVVVVRDVSARPRIEDDKADILAAVSYELRTPLVPIRSFLGTLIERGEKLDPEERQHAYEVMLRETRRLERVAKQLRRASSLEEAVLQVVPERLDWGKAVLDQIENIQREQPNREFPVVIADDLPPVMADDHLTAQVLANLLSNAVRFSPDRSPVEVTVEYAQSASSRRSPTRATASREATATRSSIATRRLAGRGPTGSAASGSACTSCAAPSRRWAAWCGSTTRRPEARRSRSPSLPCRPR